MAAPTLPTAEARLEMILALRIKKEDLPKDLDVLATEDNHVWGDAMDALQRRRRAARTSARA